MAHPEHFCRFDLLYENCLILVVKTKVYLPFLIMGESDTIMFLTLSLSLVPIRIYLYISIDLFDEIQYFSQTSNRAKPVSVRRPSP